VVLQSNLGFFISGVTIDVNEQSSRLLAAAAAAAASPAAAASR
jgi:hypothetical protein